MDNLIYILFISISAPLFLMMFLIKKKARLPIIFVLIGIFMSVFTSEVNGLIIKAFQLEKAYASVNVAPITEELIKSLPVLIYALVVTDKRERLCTAAMATGIGFALLENAYYLLINYKTFSLISALVRGFGTGLMHGMCTFLVGFGISFVKKKKKLFFVGTFAFLTTAITYHAIFNMLIQSNYSVLGALLPILTYIPFVVLSYIKRPLHRQVEDND